MIAIAMAHARKAYSDARDGFYDRELSAKEVNEVYWRMTETLANCSQIRVSQPRVPYELVIARLQKQLAEWQHNSTSWSSAHRKWQSWSDKLLAEARLQPEGGLHGDEHARKVLGKLVRKGLKHGRR